MKNMANLKDFKALKSGEKINENVIVNGTDFVVRNGITVPGSLVSSYMKKVKEDN